MSTISLQIPDELTVIIDRLIAEGRAASTSDFIIEAAERFADELEAEDEIAAIVTAADAALKVGDFVTIDGPGDEAALREQVMARVRSRLASE